VPSNVSSPTSLSLLERACALDEGAWGQLVRLYGPLVQRWCKRADLQEEDIADVFQDTFQTVASPARVVPSHARHGVLSILVAGDCAQQGC
jgi:hypothetical protein